MTKPDCPKCQKNDSVIPIQYGYPANMKLTMKKVEKGELHLGGCEITGNDPFWYCKTCEKEF